MNEWKDEKGAEDEGRKGKRKEIREMRQEKREKRKEEREKRKEKNEAKESKSYGAHWPKTTYVNRFFFPSRKISHYNVDQDLELLFLSLSLSPSRSDPLESKVNQQPLYL